MIQKIVQRGWIGMETSVQEKPDYDLLVKKISFVWFTGKYAVILMAVGIVLDVLAAQNHQAPNLLVNVFLVMLPACYIAFRLQGFKATAKV